MKLINLLIFFFSITPYVYSQYTEWTNYSFASEVNSIAQEDSLLWIGTDVGLIRYNKITDTKIYFDKSNSPIKDNTVFHIVIDKDKNKWLATKNGLIKYNNHKWEVFDNNILKTKSNYIKCLAIENDSVLWFCTHNILWKFNNGFTPFKLTSTQLKLVEINCITIDSSGNKWLGTSNNGILRFNGDKWKVFQKSNTRLTSNSIKCVFFDSRDKLWVGTNSGLCVYSSNKWKVYKRFRKRNWNYPISSISNIVEDTLGNIWLFSSGGGVTKYNQNKFIRYTYWNTNKTPISHTNCGLVDSENNLWVGTKPFGGFLIKYDHETWENIIYTSFPTTGHWLSIQLAKFDNDGTLWIGTTGNYLALTKFDGNEWSMLNGEDLGISSHTVIVYDMEIDSKGNRWFVSNKGLLKYDGNQWELPRFYEEKWNKYAHYVYSSIAIDVNDNIWIGTSYQGILKYNGDSWLNYSVANSSIPSNQVHDLVIDNSNNVWFGAGETLTKLDTMGIFTIYNSDNSSYPDGTITKLSIDRSNNLLIGTYDKGLLLFNGNEFSFYTEGDSTLATILISDSNSLMDFEKYKPIFSINERWITRKYEPITDITIEDSSTIWIATKWKGLYKISNNILSTYNISNSGLLSDWITSIAIDKEGNKWIGVFRKGLSKFK